MAELTARRKWRLRNPGEHYHDRADHELPDLEKKYPGAYDITGSMGWPCNCGRAERK